MTRALFIHRSVGRNLLRDGRLRAALRQAAPELQLSDYDQNTGTLTDPAGVRRQQLGLAFPGGDTTPAGYAQLFSATSTSADHSLTKLTQNYDLIIIKSCYPNSNITSAAQLETIKGYYRRIADYFAARPNQRLLILTSPPLAPARTNPAAAARARQLADWLAATKLASNVRVFNFFDLLATPPGQPQANTLRRRYRRWWPFDSHPNARASREIAPRLAKFIVAVI